MSKEDLEDIIAESGDITSVNRDLTVVRVVAFVAEWLEGWGGYHREILPREWAELAAKWQEEMS